MSEEGLGEVNKLSPVGASFAIPRWGRGRLFFAHAAQGCYYLLMINETISKIEERIRVAGKMGGEQKTELLKLLAELKSEVTNLASTHEDDAHSIAGFTDVSTHEATRGSRKPELMDQSLQGLAASVRGFEESHPRLVQLVNSISTTLSNLGI